jgi:hypothetical protein
MIAPPEAQIGRVLDCCLQVAGEGSAYLLFYYWSILFTRVFSNAMLLKIDFQRRLLQVVSLHIFLSFVSSYT